jgi:hypothetical protein
MKTTSFRVKDLMINVLPVRGGGGIAGLVDPESDVDFTPISPVVILAARMNKLRAIEKIGLARLTTEGFNAAALDIGRVAIGSMFLCAEDMPTCGANEAISPVATPMEGLRVGDLVVAKEVLTEALESINQLEAKRLKLARNEAKEVAPLLEDALAELRRPGK